MNRGTETEEQVQKRLRNAKAELEQGTSPGLFDHILVNDDLEKCYENLKVIWYFHFINSANSSSYEISIEFGAVLIKKCHRLDLYKNVPMTFVYDTEVKFTYFRKSLALTTV